MSLRPSIQQVLEGLRREGQVDTLAESRARTTLEVHQRISTASPWFVKAFAAFGAWVSAVFLLSFFVCVGLWREEEIFTVVGLVLVVAATALRRFVQGVFLEQLTLAVTLAGVGTVATGLAHFASDDAGVGAVLVISLALLFVYPDATMRFLATLGAGGAGLYLLLRWVPGPGMDLGLLAFTGLLHWLFLQQARLRTGRFGTLLGPVSFALACGLPAAMLTRLASFGRGSIDGHVTLPLPLLTLGLTAIALYTAWHVMREHDLSPSGTQGAAVFAALTLVAVLTVHTPAVISAVGLLTLGFHRRSSLMVGIATAFLLASGAWYYYDLSVTLLAKAIALAGSGLILLGLRLFLSRRFPQTPPPVEAR
ncbi:protein of unknown function [Myxococcus fulvus]|uniref:DUF4401 domain-containing protein n=1 Tax=Myxococcus fulvus TaxID=33 RepID=A0A511SYK7_MYXFU|nr:DUF4401 domain-containing protein [Myxococcus fulvus]AKF83144.1 hypothetical protein MFUL124B02_33010 [Myxococcus fulvus 124B02]GEN06542.1 hypothetical protein MFU01_15790 [Myxococcus fulvus]SET45649.1 protein of unknown function [Myxococcus fulvus]